MIDRVVKHVLSRPDELSQARLEDIALCAAFAPPAMRDEAARAVDLWRSAARQDGPMTLGRRQQPLLRAELDLLLTHGVDSLSREEADFLCAVCELSLEGTKPNARLVEILGPCAELVCSLRGAMRPSSGMNMLETRVRVVFAEQLQKSPRRQAALFEGEPSAPLRATFEAAGPLRIVGGVPDDCTVVVTGGPCSVDGYALGRLVAAGDCDVSENISGSVVCASGDIRCRNIIHNAFVVAKTGSVHCLQAMNPALVFGGERVTAADSISRGLFYGGRIEVGKTVQGGAIHVSRALTAEMFAPDERRPLQVVLRSGISFEEYGEQLGQEAVCLKSRAARLRRDLTHLANMARATQAEAEHAASTAVLRAFSGLRVVGALEERSRAERRVAVLNRLIGALQELYAGAEEALAQGEHLPEDMACDAPLRDVEQELEEFVGDGGAESRGLQEREEVRALYERVGGMRNDRRGLTGALDELRERMEAWIVERHVLNTQLASLNREVNAAVPEAGLDALAQRAVEERKSKLAELQRKIVALTDNPPSAEIERRLQAPLVRLMIKMMQRRIQRLNELGAHIKKCRTELAEVAGELKSKYGIVEKEEAYGAPARVSGKFEAGVKIYRDAYLLDEPNPARGAVVETEDSGGNRVEYVRGLASVFAAGLEEKP